MQLPRRNIIILLALILLSSLILSACGLVEAAAESYEADWGESPHGIAESGAFTRWDDADPPEVPANCAKCHSTPGYHDFLGQDGSIPGQVDKAAPTGTTIECEACHNEVSLEKDTAVMPSHIELTDLGGNADCMECHQGRASSVQVNEVLGNIPANTVNKDISGPGVHNSPAGPTLYGRQAAGGYEYAGRVYADRFDHAIGFDSCVACHDAHTLKVDPQRCSACHLGVKTVVNFRHIRTSNIDYDGDGNTSEGMAGEVETMEKKLLQAINAYTLERDGVEPLVINRRFVTEGGETYSTWTPRLLRAAFNYQVSTLGSGGYVHNPQYILQLLYDSIQDLGGNLAGMTRPDTGGILVE